MKRLGLTRALILVVSLALAQFVLPLSTTAAPPIVDPTHSDPVGGEAFFHDQRAYPATNLPPDALLHARQQLADRIAKGGIATLDAKGRGRGIHAPSVGEAALTQLPWSAIGLSPIGSGVSGGDFGPYPISGRVSALAAVDANTAYLGAADGGVWKTTNAGSTWTPITDSLLFNSLSVGAIAIDPNNSSTVYVGLGEQDFSLDSYSGVGILKSSDAGSTWTLEDTTALSGQSIGRIAVDPKASSNVWAAATNGLAYSTDGGTTWGMVSSGQVVTDVVIDSTSLQGPSSVYFAVGATNGGAANAVYVTHLTNGVPVTPTKLPGSGSNLFPTANVGRIRLAVSQTTPAQMFAFVASSAIGATAPLGMWTTADGGTNWTAVATPASNPGANCQCFYTLNLAVYPTPVNGKFVL